MTSDTDFKGLREIEACAVENSLTFVTVETEQFRALLSSAEAREEAERDADHLAYRLAQRTAQREAAETRAQQAEARVEVEKGRASGLLEAAWEVVAQLGSGDATAELLAAAILKHDGDPEYALTELSGMGFEAARQAIQQGEDNG